MATSREESCHPKVNRSFTTDFSGKRVKQNSEGNFSISLKNGTD